MLGRGPTPSPGGAPRDPGCPCAQNCPPTRLQRTRVGPVPQQPWGWVSLQDAGCRLPLASPAGRFPLAWVPGFPRWGAGTDRPAAWQASRAGGGQGGGRADVPASVPQGPPGAPMGIPRAHPAGKPSSGTRQPPYRVSLGPRPGDTRALQELRELVQGPKRGKTSLTAQSPTVPVGARGHDVAEARGKLPFARAPPLFKSHAGCTLS